MAGRGGPLPAPSPRLSSTAHAPAFGPLPLPCQCRCLQGCYLQGSGGHDLSLDHPSIASLFVSAVAAVLPQRQGQDVRALCSVWRTIGGSEWPRRACCFLRSFRRAAAGGACELSRNYVADPPKRIVGRRERKRLFGGAGRSNFRELQDILAQWAPSATHPAAACLGDGWCLAEVPSPRTDPHLATTTNARSTRSRASSTTPLPRDVVGVSPERAHGRLIKSAR